MPEVESKEQEPLDNCTFDINKKDPEAAYRLCSVISFIIVLVGVGIPVWWMTTRVYRAPLPLDDMYEFQLNNKTEKSYGLPLSVEYDILITIFNPNPQQLKVDLDGQLIATNLQPFLEIFSEVINFTVKTQWLYFTELGVTPKREGDYFVLTEEQLPHTITPLEKKLWSHISPRPCINLVLYFTTCKSPLYILNEKKEKVESNSFLSPRWGSVTIMNSNDGACNNKVFKPELKRIIFTFVQQLTHLLQIKGRTDKDIKEFKLLKVHEMLESSKRTLKSLAQLLSEINSIVISDDVAHKINLAMLNINKASEFLINGDLKSALITAKLAFINSEAAFSDPSLLALLYFPDDQKYAVYIPLFLPIMIPVVMSIVTIKRWYIPAKKSKLD